MESKILSNILFGKLRPWLPLFDNKDKIKERLLKIQSKTPSTYSDIVSNINILLGAQKNVKSTSKTIEPLIYTISAPTPFDIESTFYQKLIENEALRYFNEAINNPLISNLELDTSYQIGTKTLKSIAILTRQVCEELKERNLSLEAEEQEITHFVLILLRNSLITLYFSIQEYFKANLTPVYKTVEEFFLYEIEDSSFVLKLTKTGSPNNSIAKTTFNAFSFDFKGNIDNLTSLVKVLCLHHNFLNELETPQDKFISLLSETDIFNKEYKIQFGCNTNLAAYILEKLKMFCPKLTFANIDRSGYFFSNNGTMISQSLLSNSKSKNAISKKSKEAIDSIFKENHM